MVFGARHACNSSRTCPRSLRFQDFDRMLKEIEKAKGLDDVGNNC